MDEAKLHSSEDVADQQNQLVSEDPEDKNDLSIDSTISSSSVEGGIEKGGHILRRRIPGDTIAWRELSKTPPPSGSPVKSFSKDVRQQQFQNKSPKSFEDFAKEFEEGERQKLKEKAEVNNKTIEDYTFKGFKKRNVPSGIQGKITDLYLKLMDITPKQLIIIVLAIVAVVVGGMLIFSENEDINQGSTLTEKTSWRKAQVALMQDLVKLNKKFPLQNRETAIHFVSAINSTLSEKLPKQPSAITILTPPSMRTSTFPTCFVSRIASVVNRVFSLTHPDVTAALPVKILDSAYFTYNGQNITAIHDDLKSYFNAGGKAVLVHDVDQIEKEEFLLVFHSFCDNYKAPDKRATFFFIVPVPESIHRTHPWNQMFAADISNDVLDRAWKNVVSDDTRPAIISRIAATVVLLNEGDSCS